MGLVIYMHLKKQKINERNVLILLFVAANAHIRYLFYCLIPLYIKNTIIGFLVTDPKPEDGPLAPPAYSDGPPGSVPGRRALPMSPPPAYEAIIQENTLPNRRGQNAAPSHANGDVPHSGGEHIDVTIHAPAIAGRRTNKRVTMKETVENITIARQVLKRMEPVPKNQVSPSNSFRAAPSPVRANSTVPNGHVTFQPNTTPARPMSRPRQVVSDAPAEEPADLEYI